MIDFENDHNLAVDGERVLEALREEMAKYADSVPMRLNGWYDQANNGHAQMLIFGLSNRSQPLEGLHG